MTPGEVFTIAAPDGTPLRIRRHPGAVPGGPVILLGHGPSIHSGLLAPAIQAFAAGAAEVWAGDLRGHGGSVSARAPLAHLDPATGWDALLGDMATLMQQAFRGVPRARRLLVGGAISAHLMLELIARDPELAGHLVMAAPMPHQPGVGRLGTTFLRLRAMTRPIDRPDPQLMHHVYGFLRAQLPRGTTSVETISADPAVVRAVEDDPRGFPTPTPGYWLAVFPGMVSTWTRIAPGALPEDLRVLILTGPGDPQTRGGKLVAPMLDWFAGRGVRDAGLGLVDGVRANVLIDAGHLPVATTVMDWFTQATETRPAPLAPLPPADPAPAHEAYLPALTALGLNADDGLPPLPMLIDLCYAALDDDTRWIELIYRLALGAEAAGHDLDTVIEALHPHWQRAFELREELRAAATLGRLYDDLIDRLDLGVAVLDGEGRLRHANPAFGRALSRLDAAAGAAHEVWLRQALGGISATTTAEVPLLHDGRLVGVSFVPASLGSRALGAQPAGRLVVLRLAAGASADLSHRAGLLALAHGLTGQEGAAALHVAEGLSTEAAARAMGIAENTLRSHLKQVFDKMGVSSRTELAHRVLAGPLGWLAAETSALPLAANTPTDPARRA